MAANLNFTEDFKKKWLDLSPRMRNITAVGGLFATLVVIGSIFVHPHGRPHKHEAPPSVSNLALPKPKDQTDEELAAQNKATSTQVSQLRQDLVKSDAEKADLLKKVEDLENNGSHAQNGVTADLMKEVMQMRTDLDTLKSAKPNAGAPALNDPLPIASATGKGAGFNGGVGADDAATSDAGTNTSAIRITGGAPASDATPATDTTPTPYLSAGAMFEAILLNGMDAPTSQVGEKNPVPAVLRVKTEALLPNNYSYNIKECFVLVSGFGSLSSERAQLRTETISCVRDGGKALESKIDGYVVGEDGRVGMRGRLVSKQGQLIAKSLAAGVLSGFSSALTPQQIPQLQLGSGDGYISTQRATLGSIGETGVATGFSTAAKSVASFYLEMAKEMTPVVEIDAGRKVTVVLIKGVELK